jgi:glycerophosphoryl diester phosphodiesterase
MSVLFRETPALCGHRGSGRGVVAGERENTLGSFRAAVAAGLEWVEVDARFNADDVLVASHDPVVADGRFISTLPAAETDALGLMRVEDLLSDLPPEIGVDVDVKSSLEDALRPRDRTTAALVAEMIERGRSRPLLVSSFDASVLAIVRERLPGVPVGLLTWAWFPLRKAIVAAAHLGASAVAPNFTSFPLDGRASREPPVERPARESIAVAHEAGLAVVAWCPDPAIADQLAEAGVDCLIVDDVPAFAAGRGALRS